jgi:hypothetical protein
VTTGVAEVADIAGAAPGSARADELFLRQVLLTTATLGAVGLGLLLLRMHVYTPTVVHYTKGPTGMAPRVVHRGAGPLAMKLAVGELALCVALAVVALGHAVGVAAFVLKREAC